VSAIAIRVKNLSKLYRIGEMERYKALRDTLANAFSAPVRAIRSAIRGKRSIKKDARADNYIWALKDISFDVEKGEVVGIIGRNGAGKTTLLKLLCRITEPTEGYAEIRGRVGSLLEIGTGFHPEMTGRENIYLNGAILGMKKREIDRKFAEIVDFSGVEKFIDTPLKRYSSGMQVRLGFSVAAHLEPEILLVDEVLAVGDVEFQKKCLGKMGEVAKGGRTVLFVSHNMLSIQNLCTRGILLESGRIAMQGNITDVINKYLDLGSEKTGEVSWASPEVAPGNERVRLKAVRIVSEGQTTGVVDISKEFRIEVDYWNLEPNARRVVSIHLHNSMGICVLALANYPSASIVPDPWYERLYPKGIFRTSCTIPGDNIIVVRDILSFIVRETGGMRKEFTGKFLGTVRPRLDWHTVKIE